MNSLSMLSAYAASSVYSPASTSSVKAQEEFFAAKGQLTSASSTGDINDEAIISDEAQAMLAKEQNATKSGAAGADSNELSPEEKQQVSKMRARDAEVRTHEQAHISAAAGINASAPTYTYETGPDGKRYAVAGEVNISFNKSDNPAENMAKAEAMKAAALAPAEPSSQDLSVARHADVIMAEAKQALSDEQKNQKDTSDSDKKQKEKQTDAVDKPNKVKKENEPINEPETAEPSTEFETNEPTLTTESKDNAEKEASPVDAESIVKIVEKSAA